jgi:hypothetical protein
MSVFRLGAELAGQVHSAEGTIQTQKLLEVCRQVLPIVGAHATGPAFGQQDVISPRSTTKERVTPGPAA